MLSQVRASGRLCPLGWSRVSFFNPVRVCIFGSGYFCGSYVISIANAGIRSTDSLFVALSHPCCKVTHLVFSLEQEKSLHIRNSRVMPLSAPNLSWQISVSQGFECRFSLLHPRSLLLLTFLHSQNEQSEAQYYIWSSYTAAYSTTWQNPSLHSHSCLPESPALATLWGDSEPIWAKDFLLLPNEQLQLLGLATGWCWKWWLHESDREVFPFYRSENQDSEKIPNK